MALRYFKVWFLSSRNSVMKRMAFRFNFFLMIVGVFFQMILVLVFMKVIFGSAGLGGGKLSGWTHEQALIVVASSMIIEGLIWVTCSYLNEVAFKIKTGSLDLILVKPIDAQFLISVERVDPEDWARIVTALFIFFSVVNKLNLSSADLFVNSIFYVILIISAYLILYSIALIINTVSFWTTEISSLFSLLHNIAPMSQYPTDIFFHKAVRIFFSTVIPLAFIATVPAKVFIYGPRLDLILYSFALAIIFFAGSRKFWLYGLKHYSSASS